jgi:pimeloyl-ACP methyl ester carboxylesterase
LWATQVAPAADLLDAEVRAAAWRAKPTWYLVATQDGAVQPDLQRFFATRMGATTYEIDSNHMVMLSHPDVVVDVIREAAGRLHGAPAVAASNAGGRHPGGGEHQR